MTKFKGTKENWDVVSISTGMSNGIYISGKESYFIAKIFENGRTDDQNEANALLISKAPEMLQMLKTYVKDLKNIVTVSDARDQRIYQIETLIKEATEI